MKWKFIFLFAIILSYGKHTYSQDSIVVYYNRNFKGERPKLGLVLSGGGAKGMAHVGVLKVMEDVGLKPDYITGTSMGSIVAGLYAIGISPDSMQNLMEHQDWNSVLSNKQDFRRVNMEEKWDYGEYIAEFPIYGWKPNLPQGAIRGQELELLFNKLTVSAAGDTIFDDFPIPYRAVAVDVLKGKVYVFKTGNLAVAMRSSMSIPTIMDPVKYRGMLLVDGGLMKNFPVDVCKEMGADVIIGVYTGGQLLPEEKLNTLFNILKQSSLMAGIKDSEKQKKSVDLFVEPKLSDLSAADFDKASIIIDRGYKAAIGKKDDFKRMAAYFNKFPAAVSKKIVLKDSVKIDSQQIYMLNENPRYKRIIANVLKTRDVNKWITPDIISRKIETLYGTRLFRKLSYEFLPSSKNDSALILRYKVEKERNKYLTFALEYKSESKIGLNVGVKYRNLLIPGSKLDLKFRISEYPAARFRYFTYLGYKTNYGMAAEYNFRVNNINFYTANNLTGKYVGYNNIGEVNFYRFLGVNAALSLGGGTSNSIYKRVVDIDNQYFYKIQNQHNFLKLDYKRNYLDKKYFSNSGSLFELKSRFFMGSKDTYYIDIDSLLAHSESPKYITDTISSYLKIGFNYIKYIPLWHKLVMENSLNVLLSINSPFSQLNSAWIGGVNNYRPNEYEFWGLPEYSNLFSNGWIYRIGLRYNFYDKLYLSAKVNAMFSAQNSLYLFDASDNDHAIDSYVGYYDNYLVGGGLQLSYESIIGPIRVTVAKSSLYSTLIWHILIGYKF